MSENIIEVFGGIDVSEVTLDMGFLPSKETLQFAHDEKGLAEVVQRLTETKLCRANS